MKVTWGDLNARARGLAAHLADEATLDVLAGAGEPARLSVELARRGLVDPDAVGTPTPEGLERALARRRGERLSLVARWAGDRVRHLGAVFLDEDRRSVRALVRGALAGAPPVQRLAGLCPTPSLPSPALERLARERGLEGVAEGLEASDHPYAPRVRRLAGEVPPDLFRFELALAREFAGLSEASWRAGRVRDFRADTLDLENARTLLLGEAFGDAPDPGSAFLEGGRILDAAAFDRLLAEPSAEARRDALAGAFAGSFAGPVLADPGVPDVELPRRILGARIRAERRAGRLEPHTAAPLLEYLLRLRAEAVVLRRLVWGAALGAPAARLRA